MVLVISLEPRPRAGAIKATKATQLVTPAAKKVIYQPDAPARDPVRFPRWRVGLICSSMRNFLAGVIGFGVGRGFAISSPFALRAPDNAPETWTWSTRSEGGCRLARPQPRRKPDRVQVPSMCWTCGSLVW